MATDLAHEASIPNPALQSLSVLIGEWATVGTHFLIPGTTFHGRTVFDWIEGGAFLRMRSEIEEAGIPSGITIFGTDDVLGQLFLLYFDERGVSRRYDASFEGNILKWWRNAPGLSQRYSHTLSDDGRTLLGKGEMSEDGTTWQRDLDLTYQRASELDRV
ncbi:MAG: hypothetical protein QM758_06095 [Armatimonas sp.]